LREGRVRIGTRCRVPYVRHESKALRKTASPEVLRVTSVGAKAVENSVTDLHPLAEKSLSEVSVPSAAWNRSYDVKKRHSMHIL